MTPLDSAVLPAGIRSRFVPGVNGLKMHVLEAGFESGHNGSRRPCILLLHGFSELSYSWRNRCATDAGSSAELRLFAGRAITVPACFIAGKSDWGVYQAPGAFEKMQASACTRMVACHLLPGAGHWVQQERAQEVAGLLLEFVRGVAASNA